MIRVVSLLLPALIPSWRFFKTVEPSPRVQWTLCGQGADWQEYHPRPAHLSWIAIIRRLFWNPDWNEALFMVSLAERLTIAPTDATLNEIWQRVGQEAVFLGAVAGADLQFRLLFVSRDRDQITSEMTYLSERRPLSAICA